MLSRRRGDGMWRVPPIDSVEHVGQLRRGDPHHAVGRRRPCEPSPFQPLRVERHADPVMPKDLHEIASGAAKHIEITGMRIAAKRPLDLQGKAVHAPPHVGPPDRKPDPHAGWKRNHRRSSAFSTSRSEAELTEPPTRTR
jgi:hypothetical protein